MMVNGVSASQSILTLTIQAKGAGVGQNPSYINIMAPELAKIPIKVKDAVPTENSKQTQVPSK